MKVGFQAATARLPNGHHHSPDWLYGHPQHWYWPPWPNGGYWWPLTALADRRGDEAARCPRCTMKVVERHSQRRPRCFRCLPRAVGISHDGRQRVVDTDRESFKEFCSCTHARATRCERTSGCMRHGYMGGQACSWPHSSGHGCCHAHWNHHGLKAAHLPAASRPSALMTLER